MIRWRILIDKSKAKDKAFSRFVHSGDFRSLDKIEAGIFVCLLAEYGSRKEWRPAIRQVLEFYHKKFPVEKSEEKSENTENNEVKVPDAKAQESQV